MSTLLKLAKPYLNCLDIYSCLSTCSIIAPDTSRSISRYMGVLRRPQYDLSISCALLFLPNIIALLDSRPRHFSILPESVSCHPRRLGQTTTPAFQVRSRSTHPNLKRYSRIQRRFFRKQPLCNSEHAIMNFVIHHSFVGDCLGVCSPNLWVFRFEQVH